MTRNANRKTQGRRFYKRALVLSVVIYGLGLAALVASLPFEVLNIVGLGFLCVGSIALAKTVIDGLISISSGLRAAVILALIGAVGYAALRDLGALG